MRQRGPATYHGMTKDCPTPLPNGSCPGHPIQLISDDRADLLVAREALDKIEAMVSVAEKSLWYVDDDDVKKIITDARSQFRAK